MTSKSESEIAAQAAREAAQEIVNEWVDSGQYATSKSARRACEKAAIESIAALILRAIEESRQPEWISVEKRLPELLNRASSQVLLLFTNENAIEIGWLRDADEDGRNLEWILERTAPQDERITYRHRDGQVTHWMNLPKPPKTGAEVEESRGQPEPPKRR